MRSASYSDRKVAVTGMGVVSPLGCDIETFWKNITTGKCGIERITKFDPSGFKVQIAAEVRDFDPLMFMEKSQIRKTDLFVQYAVAAAAMAMKDSGLADFSDGYKGEMVVSGVEPGRLGVYVGSGIGGMNTFIREVNKLNDSGPNMVSPFFVPMMIGNIAAGTIAIQYGAQGVNLPVVTACATGSHSIGEAYYAITQGRADVIIAGGCEAAINPLAIAGFTNCMALSKRSDPESASIPFDRRRDGFVIAEGAGILVLEDLDHAIDRGAKIYGMLSGYGNTCDAYHITAPHPEAEGAACAIRIAVKDACDNNKYLEIKLNEDPKIYINAHGTSTPLNDRSETLAIKKGLGEEMAYKAAVSSTKSMTGHMLGAAGAAEAVVSLLALRDGVIPPTIGYEDPDPDCDLDYTPNKSRKMQADLALSISLGFGGHNACIAFTRAENIRGEK
ncbi:MAG: beta-ketoacyl-ACP synthase II [Eubacteriales bacterium]|nr:beta-ketoacyl-ACP synthase II [Eubacteriales bacterium]